MIVSGNLSKTFGFYFSVISLLAIAACSDSGPRSDSGQAELNKRHPSLTPTMSICGASRGITGPSKLWVRWYPIGMECSMA